MGDKGEFRILYWHMSRSLPFGFLICCGMLAFSAEVTKRIVWPPNAKTLLMAVLMRETLIRFRLSAESSLLTGKAIFLTFTAAFVCLYHVVLLHRGFFSPKPAFSLLSDLTPYSL